MITPQDFERLSAYLDNQLPPRERAKLEARLARDAELRDTLADLRQTARALRALPVVKPPRNFTLTRAEARALARPRSLFPAFSFATTLVALLLAVVLVGDLFVLRAGPAAAPAPAEIAMATEAAAGSEADKTQATEESVPEAALTFGVTPTPEDQGLSESAAASEPTPDLTQTPQFGIRSALPESPTPTVTPVPEQDLFSAEPAPGLGTLQYLEIGLALLTVLLALAAFIARRRS